MCTIRYVHIYILPLVVFDSKIFLYQETYFYFQTQRTVGRRRRIPQSRYILITLISIVCFAFIITIVNSNKRHCVSLSGVSQYTQLIPTDIGQSEWSYSPKPEVVPTDILDTIRLYMSSYKFVIIGFVDSTYLDMAFNFYELNILRHNIANFIFVSQSRDTCELFFARHILCVIYEVSIEGGVGWGWGGGGGGGGCFVSRAEGMCS